MDQVIWGQFNYNTDSTADGTITPPPNGINRAFDLLDEIGKGEGWRNMASFSDSPGGI